MERDPQKGPGPREEVWGPSRFPHLRPGAEVIYNELMSDFEMDEKDFTADSWSLAVDSSFLQQHKKEVMKQQDVIYGEPGRPPRTSLLPPAMFLCVLPLPAPTSQDTFLLSHWPSRPCQGSHK